jgi:tRNA A37 methylthiotransferase MiaB
MTRKTSTAPQPERSAPAGNRQGKANAAAPRIGFVSLGCPKALVDSEIILTQLRAEGYAIAPTYDGADLVVVNTCGFIDAAVAESLDAIGEALAENGKVIVTGCLGAKDGGGFVRAAHPSVLAVTGPHAAPEVMAQVHAHLPKPHDPFTDLVPPQGIKLTPRHYAYLKISEGCNHRCTFCIIPSMRGDLVSRPLGEVLAEADGFCMLACASSSSFRRTRARTASTSAIAPGFWQGRPLKTRMTELATALDAMAREHGAWVRLHYVYPYPHVDEVIERMTSDPAAGGLLPYLDVPFQHASPRILKLMKRPANAEGNAAPDRSVAQRTPGSRHPQHLHCRLPRRDRGRVRGAAGVSRGRPARPRRLLRLLAGRGRGGQRATRSRSRRSEGGPARAIHGRAGKNQRGEALAPCRNDDEPC